MSEPHSEFDLLLRQEERMYALQEPQGPLRAHWGKLSVSGTHSIGFRKFHLPRRRDTSPWGAFPDSAVWALGEEKNFKHSALCEAPPLAWPKLPPSSDRAGWLSLCEKAEQALRFEKVQKLVPAREVRFSLSPEEHSKILHGLSGRLFFPKMENAYRFLLKSRSCVFFGATPELLFQREGGRILVPAIAGTRALAPGVPESSLREELLGSEKDRAEHEWVVDGIRGCLEKLGLKPSFPKEPVVLRVPRLLHLYTPISANDLTSIPSERLVEALHPTPAISGLPKDAAADFLFENESWDRGLFSAPLLFRRPGLELCLVAIRSALLTPEKIHFFAGAGYIRGSTAESEWEETERKLRVMQTVLFGETHGN